MDKHLENIVSKLEDYIRQINELIHEYEEASENYTGRAPRNFPAFVEAGKAIGKKFELATDGLISYIQQNISTQEAIKCRKISRESYDSLKEKLESYKNYLTGLIEHPDHWIDIILSKSKKIQNVQQPILDNPLETIYFILSKFNTVVTQLRERYNDRPTLDVKDEHDVQDLLHALLKIYFEDVRHEEPTPSSAGSSSKMDFLLVNEKIAIEAKMASDKLRDRELGKQLKIDIADYKNHGKCDVLVCVIYDPNSKVLNPNALIKDLEDLSSDNLKVKVIVKPSQ